MCVHTSFTFTDITYTGICGAHDCVVVQMMQVYTYTYSVFCQIVQNTNIYWINLNQIHWKNVDEYLLVFQYFSVFLCLSFQICLCLHVFRVTNTHNSWIYTRTYRRMLKKFTNILSNVFHTCPLTFIDKSHHFFKVRKLLSMCVCIHVLPLITIHVWHCPYV